VKRGVFLLAFLIAAVLAAASSVQVVIREWDVPTPGSRPHDPEAAPDGSLWYTGQLANKLGRLDPKSGAIREFPVRTPDSGPHGLAADNAGNIWFTANSKGYIGKLDPKTGEVTEFPMPDKRVSDPHSLAFDREGMIFFTAQQANFVGRLDPKSGQISLKEVPTARALPYGIVVGPDGAAYFCEFGANKIGRIDPKTLEIREFPLPEGARPRRLANNPDGSIYYSDFARGYIGRLDPKIGKVEELASPGGARSQPYGIASTGDGTVWYSESGSSRIRSWRSTRRRGLSRPGPSPRAAGSCATWSRRRTAASTSPAAASTRSPSRRWFVDRVRILTASQGEP
jgi:virginiamycin B lyase